MEPVIRAEAEGRGIAPRVTFLGALEGRNKARRVRDVADDRGAIVDRSVSSRDPGGDAAGLPVIATAVGAHP